MKKIIVLLCLFSISFASEFKENKFEVVFSIKYNSMTLKQAAEIEKKMQELFSDACSIDISLTKPISNNIIFGGGYLIIDTLKCFNDSMRFDYQDNGISVPNY